AKSNVANNPAVNILSCAIFLLLFTDAWFPSLRTVNPVDALSRRHALAPSFSQFSMPSCMHHRLRPQALCPWQPIGFAGSGFLNSRLFSAIADFRRPSEGLCNRIRRGEYNSFTPIEVIRTQSILVQKRPSIL